MNPYVSSVLSRYLLDRKRQHRKRVLQCYQDDLAFDRLSVEERSLKQQESLACLLTHAQKHVPRFREFMTGWGTITTENAHEILHRLPVMNRRDLQQNPEDFRADNRNTFRTDATGGSTGTPMNFDVDEETYISREASLMWANHLAGWRPGDRIAMLWGADQDVSAGMGDLRLHLRCWIENRRWFNAFDMGPTQMKSFHEALNQFRPHIIVAYAGVAFEYARYLDHHGIRPRYPSKAIVTSAEVLTKIMREQIESVFPVRVFNRYGNRESGAIAAECATHNGLHIRDRHMLVEVGSPEARALSRRVLTTSLDNYVMPLIRYDTGDLAVWHEERTCKCGITGVRIAALEGRKSDVITTSEGKVVHGEFFTHLMYGQTGVNQFQFVQETLDRFSLRVNTSLELFQEQQVFWENSLKKALGPRAVIRIERVDRIKPLSSGKHCFTISHVSCDRY